MRKTFEYNDWVSLEREESLSPAAMLHFFFPRVE
ncbi:hypothetical protein AVEN_183007-1, partial [Araneus ventricosus]